MELLGSPKPGRSAAKDARIPAGKRPAKQADPSGPRPSALVEPQVRHAMIAEAAYYRSRHHGPECGSALEDWLAAEREIDAKLELSARLK
jgi:hypothetical protein